ncbi:MAG: cytidylate kinase-like family protein [Clostridiaceae bacterium]|nr:cytidylate kinase family protein [Eubacteriales bacterium]NLV47118.1 cytidylate kinase-like family protein [Clostridiaceae bacterium]
MAVITLSRQMASFGDEIAESVAEKLGWTLITRDTVLNRCFKPIVSKQTYQLLQESARFFLNMSEDGQTYRSILVDSVKSLTRESNAVCVGFGSQIIFADCPGAIHLRIEAPESVRISRVLESYHVAETDAMRILQTADRKHKRFVSILFSTDLSNNSLYDMIINTANMSIESSVASILALQKEHEIHRRHEEVLENHMASHPDRPLIIQNKPNEKVFKNESEEEFARILDMYQIDWVYEPRTFPIEWDAEGNVTLAFSPDFYLPRFNTYLELTTMNQKYVTQKNKKAKRLQELYPGVNVKIVYKKDFESLIQRFSS